MPRSHHSGPLPPGWLKTGALLVAGGIDESTLTNWQKRHLIPRPVIVPTPGGGSVAHYPPETLAIVRRVKELRWESRKAEEWLWILWLEGLPVGMLPWAEQRLGRWHGKQKPLKAQVAEARQAISAEDIRRYVEDKHRTLDGHSISAGEEAHLVDAALSAGTGDPASMAEPAAFRTLLKVGKLSPAGYPLPEPDLLEMLSPARQAQILAEAKDDEAEQARRDWQAIASLIAAAQRVDWSAAMPIIEPAVVKLQGEKPAPPSWQARKAARKRPVQPPAVIKRALTDWHNFHFRAMALAFLIGFRRDPARSKHLDDLLALAAAALSLFPQIRCNSVAPP